MQNEQSEEANRGSQACKCAFPERGNVFGTSCFSASPPWSTHSGTAGRPPALSHQMGSNQTCPRHTRLVSRWFPRFVGPVGAEAKLVENLSQSQHFLIAALLQTRWFAGKTSPTTIQNDHHSRKNSKIPNWEKNTTMNGGLRERKQGSGSGTRSYDSYTYGHGFDWLMTWRVDVRKIRICFHLRTQHMFSC